MAHKRWRTAVGTMAAGMLLATVFSAPQATAVNSAARARPSLRSRVVAAAAKYGRSRGYHVGVAVLDRETGQLYGAGDAAGTFASESVVKVFIATRLLVSGQMHGRTARMAWKMITQSDDAMASALYGRVGGDSLINWVKSHYHIRDLGYPPSEAGWWGNTHITPDGLVRLYAKLGADRRVAPWLLNAMHHAHKYGSDGTYQFFGLPSATHHAAIKQGWGCDYTPSCREADFNSTGFVDGDRYAVALLVRGPLSTYGSAISRTLTGMARTLLPRGVFPAPPPQVTHLSRALAAAKGGAVLTVRGANFIRVRWVRLGMMRVRNVDVLSEHRLRIRLPRHPAGTVHVVVTTAYGASRRVSASRLRFVPAPTISTLNRNWLPVAGGTHVTVRGQDFLDVSGVRVGGVRASDVHVVNERRLAFVAPKHRPGQVHIVVFTRFGHSPQRQGEISYVTRPHITTASLPDATVGQPYSAPLTTRDGRPGTWTVVSGALPPGLSIDGAAIDGTPTTAGDYPFTIRFTDAYGQHDDRGLAITVNSQ